MWLEGFQIALSGTNLLYLFLGTAFGLVIGVLPAVGPAFGVVLMMPFTYGMEPATAIIFLMAIHASCTYGDSVTSILINVPGGPGTIASSWDGYPMAQRGEAGRALGIATMGSFLGGVVAWACLALLAGPITALALEIGAPEYFALGVMALSLISIASKGETLKGLILACMGLILSAVGQDPVTGFSHRFSLGITQLEDNIPVVVSTLGIFAVAQLLVMMEEGGSVANAAVVKDNPLVGFLDVLRRPMTTLRAGLVGLFVGIAPALGTSLAGIAAYLVEKQFNKNRDEFGKGEPSGLVAAEVGKGTCAIGDMIPTFTLGVPGSVVGALVMAALMIHGVDPGPRFMTSGTLPYVVFAGILLGQGCYALSGLLTIRWLARIAYIPVPVLASTLTVLCFLGAYVERDSLFDTSLMVAFGLFAYLLTKVGYPVVCLVLGLILGPLVESYLYRSLVMADKASWTIFFTRPISAVLILLTILALTIPFVVDMLPKRLVTVGGAQEGSAVSTDGSTPAGDGSLPELILVVVFIALWAAMLVATRAYGPASRLFPEVVLVVGLLLAGLRLVGLLRQGVYKERLAISGWGTLLPTGGRLSWPVATALLVGMVVLTYALGLPLASVVFIVAVLLLMGYPNRLAGLAVALGSGLGCIALAQVLHLSLPDSWLGQLLEMIFGG